MHISPADRSVAIVAKADGTGAAASAGASADTAAAEPLRAGVTQPRGESADYLAAPQGARGPDTPSATADNRDWATAASKAVPAAKEKPKEEVKPALFELLIQQFNSLWRASAQAVDAGTQAQVLSQANRQNQVDGTGKTAPLVYTDPSKVRKNAPTEGA